MNVDHKRLIPYAWVLTSVVIFIYGLDHCLLRGDGCLDATGFMLVCMTIMTMPCGFFYVVFVAHFFSPADLKDPVIYFLLWLVAFVIGYLQWFVVVPGLWSLRGMTTLGLAEGGTFDGKKKKHRAREKRRRKKILKARLEGLGLAQWDERGRTPLERAMDEQPRSS